MEEALIANSRSLRGRRRNSYSYCFGFSGSVAAFIAVSVGRSDRAASNCSLHALNAPRYDSEVLVRRRFIMQWANSRGVTAGDLISSANARTHAPTLTATRIEACRPFTQHLRL